MIVRISLNSLIVLIICTSKLRFSHASSEFNSSQNYKHATPVVRNVDYVPLSSSSNPDTRIVSGGKYRSSYYYPKSKKSKNTTPASGQNPVWVVWNRQGTSLDDYTSLSPNDMYQYQTVDPSQVDYADNNFYSNNYQYSNSIMDPYQIEHSSSNDFALMTEDSDEEEEDVDDLGFERLDLDGMSKSQLKGLMKTRRTGIESLGGILSLKGLKLSALGFYYLFRGVIILLWKFLPWIFLIGLGLLFIPVPIITIPAAATGRNTGPVITMNMTDVTNNISSIVDRVAASEKCVERISCEIRRKTRDTWFNATMKLLIYSYQSHFPNVMQRMANAYSQRRRCPQYKCSWIDNQLN